MSFTKNLLILHTPGHEDIADWQSIAKRVQSIAPEIEVRLGTSTKRDPALANWQISRPSLFFSAARLDRFLPLGGKLYHGRKMPKSEQTARLHECGVPAPRTIPFIPGIQPSKAVWGGFVIVKPDRGSHGIGLSVARTEDIATHYAKLKNNDPRRSRMLVQQFIDHSDETGDLVDYRALMMFGEPIYVHKRRTRRSKRSLAELAACFSGDLASNAHTASRSRELSYCEEVIQTARKAANAFSHIPVLGIDIIRCKETGTLYVLEVNPGGTVWHLSSEVGRRQFDSRIRKASYKQFNALDRAAELLADRTLREAR